MVEVKFINQAILSYLSQPESGSSVPESKISKMVNDAVVKALRDQERKIAETLLKQKRALDMEVGALRARIEATDHNKILPFPVPLLGQAAAGAQVDFWDEPDEVRLEKEYPKGHYCLRIAGRSMEPDLPDGALVVVRDIGTPGYKPKKGALVVYTDSHGASVKRYTTENRKPLLQSLNPDYPDLSPDEDGRIVGVVVDVIESPES